MRKKIGLKEVKEALKDERFRESLPVQFKPDIAKYLQNPGCSCNGPIYRNLLLSGAKQLKEYYKDAEISTEDLTMTKTSLTKKPENVTPQIDFNYFVINCTVDELAKKLNELPKTVPTQFAVSRFEDQITCVVTELRRRPNQMQQRAPLGKQPQSPQQSPQFSNQPVNETK